MKILAVCLLIIAVTGSSCLAERPVTQPAPIQPVLEKSTTDTMQTDYKAGAPTDYSQQETPHINQSPTENPYLKPPVYDNKISNSSGGGGGSDWNPINYPIPESKVIWTGTTHFSVQ